MYFFYSSGTVVTRQQQVLLIGTVLLTLLSGGLHNIQADVVARFIVGGAAIYGLCLVIGLATEQLGGRMGPKRTGFIQSAISNLPVTFIGISALQAGLVDVVQASLIGSMLANSLLVLGLAFFFGGIRNGRQQFHATVPRVIAALTLLTICALTLPTLMHQLTTSGAPYTHVVSIIEAVVLLIVFITSIPFSITEETDQGSTMLGPTWPSWVACTVLVLANGGAVLVADWFVAALEPAIGVLRLSATFTSVVVVAIVSNAAPNFVGIALAYKNEPDYAINVILNSAIQVVLTVMPILVLVSFFVGNTPLTFVVPPMLLVALVLATMLSTFVTYDGESSWLKGLTMIALYTLLALSFFWG